MKSILIIGLVITYNLMGCCGKSSVSVKDSSIYSQSPTVVRAFPTPLEKYQAAILIRDTRRTHPESTAGTADSEIASRHLRTKSRIVEPHALALKTVAQGE